MESLKIRMQLMMVRVNGVFRAVRLLNLIIFLDSKIPDCWKVEFRLKMARMP